MMIGNYDFNNADLQTDFEVIPSGTIVPVEMKIRPGGEGDGGWLRKSKAGDAHMLDCELTIIEGAHYNRKIFANLVIDGQSEGHRKAILITLAKMRAMIESAYGVKPDDKSD